MKIVKKHKNVEEIIFSSRIAGLLLLGLLIVLATVTFWGTFFVTVIVINALPIHGLADSCVPPIFSAFIAGLVLIYVVTENRQK